MSKAGDRKRALQKHYATCERLAKFLGVEKPDGVVIAKTLARLEHLAHKGAEAYCNGEAYELIEGGRRQTFDFRSDENAWERFEETIIARIRPVFHGALPPLLFVNGDCRVYALKLEPNSVPRDVEMHTDWGGYQILSPEI